MRSRILCAGPEKTQPLRAVLDEDPLVVADAVLNGVFDAVGHRRATSR